MIIGFLRLSISGYHRQGTKSAHSTGGRQPTQRPAAGAHLKKWMRSFLRVYWGTSDTHLSQTILVIIGVESSPMHVMRDYRSRELAQGEDEDPIQCRMHDHQIASYGPLRATLGVQADMGRFVAEDPDGIQIFHHPR